MLKPRAPRASVVIPAFNRRRLLPLAIRDALTQTSPPAEVLVVDDASTDGTAQSLTKTFGKRLRVLRLQRNSGASAARNAGWRKTRAPFVAFLDSDDRWRPDFLKTLLPAFEDPRVMVAVAGHDVIDARGRKVAEGLPKRNVWDPVLPLLTGLTFVPLPSACVVRRSALEAVGGWDPALRQLNDDLDLWYRIGLRYGAAAFELVGRPLMRYRRHAGQGTKFLSGGVNPWNLRARLETLSDADKSLAADLLYFLQKHESLIEFCWENR